MIIRNLAIIKNGAKAPSSFRAFNPSVKTDGNG
jgi:hypothetical protein